MIIEGLKDLLKRPFTKKYKTGLVLSGGAARGFAHLGVIKLLKERDIHPNIIVGVSAGSIVGSFLADGFDPEEVLDIFLKQKIFSIVEFSPKRKGLLKLEGMKKILKNNLRTKNIEDLKTPLIIGATDLTKGESVYFRHGSIVDAVIASSSIPVVFPPVFIEKRILVDGGVTNNLPTEPIEKQCKTIIASHVNPLGKFNNHKGILHIALQSFHVSISGGVDEKKRMVDYFIEPKGLENYSLIDIEHAAEMMELGYQSAAEVFNSKLNNAVEIA